MRFTKRHFVDQSVHLDQQTFISCSFTRCKLIYRGGDLPKFSDCLFTECDWVFDESAEKTLEFLSWMYHGLSEAGPDLIQYVFEKIVAGELIESQPRAAAVGD